MLRIQYALKLAAAEEHSPLVERVAAVVEMLDAERLLARLGGKRGPHGRDDYPNRVLWHCLIVFACLNVRTVPEGRRWLELSAPLRRLCGIESAKALPPKHAFYRFEKRLAGQLDLLEQMFARLVQELQRRLPGFGERLATDSTKLHSQANGRKPAVDKEASWKKYEHTYTDETGQQRKSAVKWFGYKLHLIVDVLYELPLAGLVTTAKDNDAQHDAALWKQAKKNLPGLAKMAKSNAKDKGYDENAVYQTTWQDGVAPIIKLREQTAEENKVLLPENQQLCPRGDALVFDGYETARRAVRYKLPQGCPRAGGAGYCELADSCAQHKVQRVKITAENLRHLGPVVRESKKFARLYKGRTAVERVNARLKAHDGLDEVRRRGEKRVSVWAMIALLCMNAFALSMAAAGRREDIRKTVYSIAA